MVETMEPDSPSAREIVLRLVDRLYVLLTNATIAREQGDLPQARRLLRDSVRAHEDMHLAMANADERTRRELMPSVLELSAAEALLLANANAATLSLAENRLRYSVAILAAKRVTHDTAYEGRARSSYGAVLVYFQEYTDAATELQCARQCLHENELGSWVQATTRLAHAYVGLDRLSDAITVLHGTMSTFEAAPYQRPRALTSHHIAAATLLARLRVRNGQRALAKEILALAMRRLEPLPNLHDTPEYRQFRELRSIGFMRYEFRQRRHNRTMLI